MGQDGQKEEINKQGIVGGGVEMDGREKERKRSRTVHNLSRNMPQQVSVNNHI